MIYKTFDDLFCPRYFWYIEMLRQIVQMFIEFFDPLFVC